MLPARGQRRRPSLRRMRLHRCIGVLVCVLAACAPVPEMGVDALPPALTSHQLPADGFDLHYVESGPAQGPLVLFVHGTPGSWQAFARYLDDPRLNSRARLISVDRPGFGLSAGSGPVPAFREQSQWIGQLLADSGADQPAIVVGHSLGGSLVYRLALDYPEQIGAVVSISAPVDPSLSGPRWYNQLARVPGARWVIGQDLAYSNDEMMPLVAQLKPIAARLAEVEMPVTIIHGAQDDLVKIGNADFAAARLPAATLRYRRFEADGHFIVWEHHDAVVAEIERLLDAPL